VPSRTSTWALEVAGVFAKEWRTELRTRYALNTLGLFGFTTLVVVAAALGPLGVSAARSNSVLPVLLWIILLFAGAAGLPRSFVAEEETGTALALRLAAPPSVLFAGKVVYGVTLTWALEALISPLFLAVMDPVLLPLLLLAVELTRAAVAGDAAGVALPQLMLYDASITIAGLMLFPTVWNP
jgi:ABC-type transport system involved in cytochrome c biogenesis permease component